MPTPFNASGGGFSGFAGMERRRQQPASVRHNNPGAQWPGPVATRFGSTGSQRIGGGNLIATFPTPVHGAAAHIALLDRSYTGMTLAQAIRKWTGGTSDPSRYIQSVTKATGLKPDTILTHEMFANRNTALPFVQAMAGEEAGRSGTLTSEQWRQGYDMAFPDAAGPTVEIPTGGDSTTGRFLDINAADTRTDPGGISQGGEFTLGSDTSLGSDVRTEFTGPEYAEQIYQPSGPESPTFVAENLYDQTGNAPRQAMDFTDTQSIAAANSFDEWWKSDPITASSDVSTASANTGGSIWSGDETLSNFGGNLALGSDLSTDLGSLGYGDDYPAVESPGTESPFTQVAEGTGIPVEPDPLNQDVGDYEWTTSPEDRRFLPGEPESVEPTPTRSLTLGPNIRDFGGQNFGTPLSLGAYLNMSLASLRYGEGYVSGGDVITPGSVDHTNPSGTPPLNADTTTRPPATGQVQIDPLTGQPYDLESIPEGVAVSPDVRRGELVQSTTPTVSRPGFIGEGEYYDWTTGSVRPMHATATARDNPFNQGYGQSATSREGAALMSFQAFGGNPNRMLVSDEELIAQSEFGGARYMGPGAANRTARLRSLYPHGVFTDAARTGGSALGGGG